MLKAGNIIPAQTTESEVLRMLGTPTATSQFGEKTWYYMGGHKETVAFLAPEVTKQEVLRITFAENKVSGLEFYDEKQMREFAISDHKTPTAGEKLSFVEQLVGNVGRFNKKQDAMGGGGGVTPGGGAGRSGGVIGGG
jgi:outer membrane protein assembly factor BamE (lipoprotein component of BamABCDE complex)